MLFAVHTFLEMTIKTAASSKVTDSMPSPRTKVSTQMIDAIPIEPLEPPSVFLRDKKASQIHLDTSKLAPVPAELKGVTDDPAAAAFLNKYDPKDQEVGVVTDTPSHTQQLFVNAKVIFEASQILRRRTMAHDGTVVLAAVIEETHGPNDKTETTANPSTVWMIDPSGSKRQVSPPNVNASTPMISPDSKWIAFTGVSVGTDGSEEEPLLWVYDLTTSQYRKFGPSQKGHNYTVGAAEWSEDSKILYVLEDYGETRGHLVMRAVKLSQ